MQLVRQVGNLLGAKQHQAGEIADVPVARRDLGGYDGLEEPWNPIVGRGSGNFFDRNGVTLRRGDMRRINRHRLDLFGPSD